LKANMLSVTKLYEEAQKRLEELYQAKVIIEKDITSQPEGKLHVVRSKNRIQYYVRTNPKDKSGQYIKKSEYDKIQKYVRKSYNEHIDVLITKELMNIEKFLRNSGLSVEKIRRIYSDYPQEIKDMISPVDVMDDEYIKEWLETKYVGKRIQEDIPVYISDRGDHVRSKSELNIANMLIKNNIPYKYECPLLFSKGMTIYPDFTLLDIRNRREIYWEHRGMMGDENYANHSVFRLKQYLKEGLFLGTNLIITEETLENPLGTDEIERTINHYFK